MTILQICLCPLLSEGCFFRIDILLCWGTAFSGENLYSPLLIIQLFHLWVALEPMAEYCLAFVVCYFSFWLFVLKLLQTESLAKPLRKKKFTRDVAPVSSFAEGAKNAFHFSAIVFLLYSVYLSVSYFKVSRTLCPFDMFEERFITHFVLVSDNTVHRPHLLPTFVPNNRRNCHLAARWGPLALHYLVVS